MLDEELAAEAMRRARIKTKRAMVEVVLRPLIQLGGHRPLQRRSSKAGDGL